MISQIYSGVINAAHNYLFTFIMPLAQDFKGTASVLLVLYFVITILTAMKSGNPELLGQMAVTGLVFAVVAVLVFTDGVTSFRVWVYEPVYGTSKNLAAFFSNPAAASTSNVSDIFTQLDNTLGQMATIAGRRLADGYLLSTTYWSSAIVFGGLFIGYAVIYAAFVLYMLIGYVGLHILMVAAPVAMLLAGIPFTRHVFTSWFRTLVTFALIPVFTAIVMGLTNTLIQDSMTYVVTADQRNSLFTPQIAAVFLVLLIAWFLMKKAPEFAAALTGGTMSSISGMGVAAMGLGAAMVAANKNLGGHAAATSAASKAADYGGRSSSYAYSRAKQVGQFAKKKLGR